MPKHMAGKLELFWKWENDNGLYTESGTMKALWSNEKKDETWSKEETQSLCDYFRIKYKKVSSFKEFIESLSESKLKPSRYA